MPEHELEDDRPRRRELTCLASGALAGGVLGTLAGDLVQAGQGALIVIGTVGVLLGGLVSALIAPHLSLEDWDPQLRRHSYVGTKSPDDDIR
jgi:hypothetical protein